MSTSSTRPLVVAIDGPAASGKGTLARRVAQALGFALLDTGGLYRAVALSLIRRGGDLRDTAAAAATARSLTHGDIENLMADPALRLDSTAQGASIVSAVPDVRAALLDFQRGFAAHPPGGAKGAVLDGRDIGTVICPAADAKLFVTASPEVRAQRRLNELLGRGDAAIYADVLKDMKDRDARDSQRAVSPLVPAADAYLLDTSSLDAAQAFDAAMTFIRSRPAFGG
ncbi:(d)CMP kinase [Aerophototrophica crusticola]|uniref:Cytidylate kinase n=1 Tax=Aerophototrophica crusticola TaxID=1709002 RepID=A0A858RB30_9PROT|nr:(d)CMP kinase [Rhodospirillaceae bacterium B3]